jgi:hypothetical protein
MVASITPHRDEVGLADGLMLINGRWVAAADEATWSHLHPATGEQVASFPVAGPAGQRHRIWPGRHGVDRGREPRYADDQGPAGRHGRRQRVPAGAELAVRRLPAVRAGARGRPGRD